jgi:hypothetical protein
MHQALDISEGRPNRFMKFVHPDIPCDEAITAVQSYGGTDKVSIDGNDVRLQHRFCPPETVGGGIAVTGDQPPVIKIRSSGFRYRRVENGQMAFGAAGREVWGAGLPEDRCGCFGPATVAFKR